MDLPTDWGPGNEKNECVVFLGDKSIGKKRKKPSEDYITGCGCAFKRSRRKEFLGGECLGGRGEPSPNKYKGAR